MKHLFAAALAATLVSAPAVAQDAFGPLLTPATLEEAQGSVDDLLILDIRTNPEFNEGHIDGAVNAPYGRFRGPDENPGQLPDAETLTQFLRNLGVEADRPTVITYQGGDITDFGAAARVYWTLTTSGVSQLAILNGGLNAWTEAGKALGTQAPLEMRSDFTVDYADTWMATAEDVQAVIDGGDEALLLDARPESFWAGNQSHPAAARPGTLPQSEYFEHAGWFDGGPTIVDAEKVRALAEEQGFTDADTLISFCNTGHWAATNWFALSELAGIDNVKLYPESMVGWSNAGYVMANVPGPVRNLWNQIKGLF